MLLFCRPNLSTCEVSRSLGAGLPDHEIKSAAGLQRCNRSHSQAGASMSFSEHLAIFRRAHSEGRFSWGRAISEGNPGFVFVTIRSGCVPRNKIRKKDEEIVERDTNQDSPSIQWLLQKSQPGGPGCFWRLSLSSLCRPLFHFQWVTRDAFSLTIAIT